MATMVGSGAPWPALSEHRVLRFVTLFLLYVAQGLPIGLFHFAVPAWMAANGASAVEIGAVVSAATLPWTFKFFNGFAMDRWAFLAMGRRRAWLIGAQLLIVCSLAGLAFSGATARDIALLSAFAFLINAFTTVQDVAIDGMAIDLIPDAERGRANGFMFGGQAAGMALGGALGGSALALGGILSAGLANAAIVAALLAMILVLRERPGERLMPWSPGAASAEAQALHAGAWLPILRGVLRATLKGPTLLFLVGPFSVNIAYGLALGAIPLLGTQRLGWSDADISALSSTGNLVAAGVAIALVGLVADRLGARRIAVAIAGCGVAVGLAMVALQDAWTSPALFIAFVVGVLVLDTAARTASCAVAMRLCDPTVGATQFGLFMASGNLGITVGAALLGPLAAVGGLVAILAGMTGAYALGAIALIAARVGR